MGCVWRCRSKVWAQPDLLSAPPLQAELSRAQGAATTLVECSLFSLSVRASLAPGWAVLTWPELWGTISSGAAVLSADLQPDSERTLLQCVWLPEPEVTQPAGAV